VTSIKILNVQYSIGINNPFNPKRGRKGGGRKNVINNSDEV
jgi:hypothetical protein